MSQPSSSAASSNATVSLPGMPFSPALAMPSGQQQPSPDISQPSQHGVSPPDVVGAASPMELQTTGSLLPQHEKRKLIQQQLVMLLHAHKCQRHEREQQGCEEYRPCNLPHCRTMKNVLNHMTECQAGRSCTYHHCASSRQIITHWKNCQRHDCPVCMPLKSTSLAHNKDPLPPNSGWPGPLSGQPQPQLQMQSDPPSCMDQSSMPGDMGQPPRVPYSVPIPTIQQGPPSMVLAWHQDVNLDIRQHLVRKLVEAIYPVQDPAALQDRRVASLVTYAMKVEKAIFETTGSREEYYQLLAEKIYRIRKELEERRKLKQSSDLRQPAQVPYSIPIPIQLEPPSMVLAWHQAVNLDLRHHLIRKVVEAIHPVQDCAALQDPHVASLVTSAMKVEKEIFEMAGSQEEYYQLLEVKIYQLRKEREENNTLVDLLGLVSLGDEDQM